MEIFVHMPYAFNAFMDVCVHLRFAHLKLARRQVGSEGKGLLDGCEMREAFWIIKLLIRQAKHMELIRIHHTCRIKLNLPRGKILPTSDHNICDSCFPMHS